MLPMPRIGCLNILAEQLTMTVHSVIVLLILFFLLAVTVGMFWALVWRETSNRRSVVLAEWARLARFKIISPDVSPPAPLPAIGVRVRTIECLRGKQCTLARVAIERTPDAEL